MKTSVTIEKVNGLNQLTNSAATGGIVRVAGYLNETGLVTIAGAPARMATATNFESEVYAPSLTNTVTIAAADLSSNAATTNRVFTVASNGAFGSLTYDLNGNLLKKDTRLNIAWDEFDRCNYIGYGTTNTRVGYDPLGRWNCLAECTGATTNSVRYFKWEGYRLAEEQNAAGTVVRRYFPGGFWFNNANYFYLTDHLGSVRQVTDASGNVVARFEYDPYGRRTQTYGSLQVDIGFTGHFHHGPSGLIFAPLRIYDPETGRWISRDPIQEKGGLNLYAYCGGDPVNSVDTLGLATYLLTFDPVDPKSSNPLKLLPHTAVYVDLPDRKAVFSFDPAGLHQFESLEAFMKTRKPNQNVTLDKLDPNTFNDAKIWDYYTKTAPQHTYLIKTALVCSTQALEAFQQASDNSYHNAKGGFPDKLREDLDIQGYLSETIKGFQEVVRYAKTLNPTKP